MMVSAPDVRVRSVASHSEMTIADAYAYKLMSRGCDDSVSAIALRATATFLIYGLGNGTLPRSKHNLDLALFQVQEVVNSSRRSVSQTDYQVARSLYGRLKSYYASEKLAMNYAIVRYIDWQLARH